MPYFHFIRKLSENRNFLHLINKSNTSMSNLFRTDFSSIETSVYAIFFTEFSRTFFLWPLAIDIIYDLYITDPIISSYNSNR